VCCVHLGPLQEWFAALDDNTADALAFVVCVDSIGSGDGLYLHTSKKRTSVVAAPFFAAFERAAEVVGVDLVFNRKKVNLAAAPAWEHEVFARERIPALTVSALAQERPNMQRARLFDDRCVGVGWVCCECVCLLWFTAAISHRFMDSARLSSKAVLRNTKVLAEAIGAMIYGEEKVCCDRAADVAWSSPPHTCVHMWPAAAVRRQSKRRREPPACMGEDIRDGAACPERGVSGARR